jgi:hypothetical protein
MMQLTDREYAHFYFEDYDLDAQLIAIRAFLSASRVADRNQTEEIEALARRAKEIGSDDLVGMWTDELHSSVYHDAARSAAAVGMLAPFVENLFTVIFRGIATMGEDVLGHDQVSARSHRAKAHFWNPQKYYEKEEVRTDLAAGIVQLVEASALKPHLPDDLKDVLTALFDYRNRMLHNGFEWPPVQREAFGNRVKYWSSDWFLSATSNHRPWVWYMSEQFIARVLSLIDQVLDAAGQHIRLHYERDEPAGSREAGEAQA